jgi:hypothetical protein
MNAVPMTPEQAAHETRDAVMRAGLFMTKPATYEYGAARGFAGMDFYVSGRGGALGEVPAGVVAAAFVFFAPELVEEGWNRSASVMPRAQAAREWAGRLHAFARENYPAEFDSATLAALLGRVVAAASVAAAPLFAGWRALPEPEDAPALALHRLNALRELRGALHGAAVLTVGLSPIEAIIVRTPTMIPMAGWEEVPEDPAPFADRWALAEARTDRMFGRNLAVLDADERGALVDLLASLKT